MPDPEPTVDAPTRLVPLTAARLAGNGLFRFVYPFLGIVAADVGLVDATAGLLITGLAVGGMLTPVARRVVGGGGEAPRRLAVVGLLLLLAGALLLAGPAPALAATTRGAGVATALVAMVVLGLAKPLLDVGTIGYVSERTPFARRARATSVMELTWAGGLLVLGPLGALAAATSWRLSLVLLGVVAAGAALLLRLTLDGDPLRTPTRTPPPAATAEDAGTADRVRFLLAAALLFVALESTFGVVGLWLEDVRRVDPARLGALASVGAVGELAGSAFVLAVGDRLGKVRVMVVGLLACAVGFGLLPLAGSLPLALAALALGLFGTETAIVAAIPLASEVVPGRRTSFLSQMVAASSVSRALGGAVGPALLLTIGIGANTTVSAVAAVLAVVVVLDLARRVPRLAA